MKTIFAMILAILATNIAINNLAAANDFKDKNGITSINDEILTQTGTAKNAYLDGTVARNKVVLAVMSNDKKAIENIQKACINPDKKIKNTCQIISDYLS